MTNVADDVLKDLGIKRDHVKQSIDNMESSLGRFRAELAEIESIIDSVEKAANPLQTISLEKFRDSIIDEDISGEGSGGLAASYIKPRKKRSPNVTEEQVRDWVVGQNGTQFTMDHMCIAFDKTRTWSSNYLNKFEQKGMVIRIKTEGITTADLWEYVKPTKSGMISGPIPAQENNPKNFGGGVQGTGSRKVSPDKDIRTLITTARAQGFKIEPTGSGHIRVSKNGQVTSIASTPAKGRAYDEDKARLKKIGVRF